MQQKKLVGFTLIELMIVIAIIGVLASIAYPSYIDSVRKTRFGQAKEAAMQIGTSLERAVSQTNVYPDLGSAPASSYPDDLKHVFSRANSNRDFVLTTTEKTERFKIWVGINSKGTRCACVAGSCAAPTFTAATVSCPTTNGVTAF